MLQIQKKLTNSFYAMLSLPATAMGFALSIQIAALSWILHTKFGLDIHQIGYVWAAGPIAGIFGQVIIGLISDNTWFWGGRRRPFILIGGVIAALMLFALPNIDKIDQALGINNLVAVAVVVALSLDLAINISFNPTRSVIADVTPEGIERTKGYTWMQTISGAFGVLAYFIGYLFGNYALITFGIFLVLAFSVLPTLFITESRTLQVPGKTELKKEEDKTEWGQLFRIYLAHAFSWLGIQTMFVYILFYINQKLSPATDIEAGEIIAVSFAILNIVGFVLPVTVLEPLSKKIGRIKTHLGAVAAMSLGYFFIVLFTKGPVMLFVFMAVCGIGWAAVVSLPFAIMSEKVNKSKMGLFMGIFNLSVVLPQLIVSLFFGSIIQDAVNKDIIFIISGVSLAVSAVLWLFVRETARGFNEIGGRITANAGH